MERSVISFVVDRLGDHVLDQIKLARGVPKQIDKLKMELNSINNFLQTAHGMRFKDPSIRTWVADVRDIAYDVDDLLDVFFLKVESEKGKRFFRLFAFFKKHRIGQEIVTIFGNLEDVSRRKEKYSGLLQASGTGRTSSSSIDTETSLRRVYAHKEDVNIVGLEEDINRVVTELLKEEEQLHIVSICGMGGLGKSTLAKAVYRRVKSQFDCCAWYFLSQRCEIEEVLRDILRQVFHPKFRDWKNMSESQLVEELFSALKQKRYLVVLDDIWSSDVWNMLKSAFPPGSRGSKVIFTTRNKKIAAEADSRCAPFVPPFLSDEDAWDLLRKTVFPRAATGSSWSLTADLENCGKDMVKKCGGLPLVLVTLGKILATRNTLHSWEEVSTNFSSCIYSKDQGDVFTILGLSYIDLPFHLKPLFLYMGLFPRQRNIPVNVLIKMWYAEYLVFRHDDEYQVIMGRRYIEELIDRCVVLEQSTNLQGSAKTCRLHDIMRDFCIFKATEENFLRILGKRVFPFDSSSSNSHLISARKLRRCAFYVNPQRYDFPQQFKPCLRSGVFFVGPFTDLRVKYEDFKLVKVLEFNGVSFDRNLEKRFLGIIASLVNLRYLGLRKTNIKELPASMGSLVYLETLDARSTFQNFSFPDVISKLTSLKHFYISNHGHLTGVHRLMKLRILRSIRGDLWSEEMLKLIHLEKLGIVDLKSETVKVVISSVMSEFPNLRSLALSMSDNMSFSSNVESLSYKRELKKLSLNGKMASFPSTWPTNIIKLKLQHSRVKEDPMPILKNLKHLAHLLLNHAYVGEEIVCSSDGFPQLQYLKIVDLPELVVWRVETGAIPSLQTCVIKRCSLLSMIPLGFGSVITLKNLEIRDMPAAFCARVKGGGEDLNKVSHILSVIVE